MIPNYQSAKPHHKIYIAINKNRWRHWAKHCTKSIILLAILPLCLCACWMHLPSAQELPPVLQGNVTYQNLQSNTSLDSAITEFFQSVGVHFSTSHLAAAELRITAANFTQTQPDSSDSSIATSVTATQIISYEVTNLKTGKIYANTVSASSNLIVNANQMYSSGDSVSTQQRLRYNCILMLFNQLSSIQAHRTLDATQPTK